MTVPTPIFTQWSSVVDFLAPGAMPAWARPEDQERLAAYGKYEEIYWTSEEGFAERLRGDNENEIMMPTARTLVDTLDRYTAPDFGYTVDGDATPVQVATMAFAQLFRREDFLSRFEGAKRQWITQGDWLWHLTANPLKPLGKRLSIQRIDPGAYFPVFESDVQEDGDPDKVVTVHLAEQIVQGTEIRVSRLTYERLEDEDGTVTIWRSHGIFKMEKWWSATRPVTTILPREPLPPQLTVIPVYHLKNMDSTMTFGSSDLRGLESVLLGVNQTISDEDLALAFDGLGVYATPGGAPKDEKGDETNFIMGPGQVLTNAGDLKRINGVHTVTPYGDHYERLVNAVRMAVGASDAAVGKVDSATAESGIALAIQLAPIMAHTAKKDKTIVGVHTQMFYDLCFWFAVYEELPILLTNNEQGDPAPSVIITPTIGAKIPTNIRELIQRIIDLRSVDPPLISIETAHGWLRAAGVPVAANEVELILAEFAKGLGTGLPGALDDQQQENRDQQDEDVVV